MLGDLSKLETMSLARNALAGEIPSALGSLSQLGLLDLSVNALTGETPSELGRLIQLTELRLSGNALTGEIPSKLGDLALLETMRLNDNALTGEIPGELGDLAQLTALLLQENALSGSLPLSLANLSHLSRLFFDGQEVCAPLDPAFQAWLDSLIDVRGPNCDPVTGVEGEELPTEFALRGNYPNPFNPATKIVFDLPQSATVTIEVIDMLGRRVWETPPRQMEGGWSRSLEVRGLAAPSGVYQYRVIAEAGREMLVKTGSMILVK